MTGPWQVLGARVPMQEMVGIDYLYVVELVALARRQAAPPHGAPRAAPRQRLNRRTYGLRRIRLRIRDVLSEWGIRLL